MDRDSDFLKNRTKPHTSTMYHLLESLTLPGLTVSKEIVDQLIETIKKRWAILDYKREKEFLWVVFTGGTGTGKSTIFNALCGGEISETGVERPKTKNPVLYISDGDTIVNDFPFLNQNRIKIHSHKGESAEAKHAPIEKNHLALLDSPDVDSLEVSNRELAEDLYLLSDAVVFVTSQEKYADDTPSQFLFRIQEEGKPCFFCFNKAAEGIEKDEVIRFYRDQGITIDEERFFFIPYIPSLSFDAISNDPGVEVFTSRFFEALEKEESKSLIADEQKRSVRALKDTIDRLIEIIKVDNRAGQEWLAKLDSLFVDASTEVIEKLEADLREENQSYLKREIKKVFGRYDLLAKPRRYVSQFVRAPLFFLGIGRKESSEAHEKDFRKIRKRADSTLLISGIHRINRLVLEGLSPDDETSPLYMRMRGPDICLSDQDVKTRILREQEILAAWLEETFNRLTEGISAGKKIGIYSTSLLWGIMILLFEIVVLGGGITLLEAVLDSFIAPFVTKGSAELFAYHEIRKVAREMNSRYREGLLSIVMEQKERYRSCMSDDLITPDTTVRALETFSQKLEDSI